MNTQSRFISPMSDYGFKVAFANEANTLFLRKALKAVTKSQSDIKEVKFTRNEQGGITLEARGGVYDVFCKDENERYFIVEMQLGNIRYYIQRAKFYTFHRFNIMVDKGEYKFDNLTTIFCVGFLAFDIFPESKEYFHFCCLKNQHGEVIDDQIVHIIIEISKFDKKVEELVTDLDKLLFFMKNLQNLENLDPKPAFLDEAWIRNTMAQLNRSSMTKDERHDYEISMAKNAAIIYTHQREIEEAAEEAAEKARAEEAKKAALQINKAARKMKKNGLDLVFIAETLGLPLAEVEKI